MRTRSPRFAPGPVDDLLVPDSASHTARALMSLARRSRFEALKGCEAIAAPGDLAALRTLRDVALAHLPGEPYVVSDVLADPWVAEPLDAALRRAPFAADAPDHGETALARALRRFVDRGTLPAAHRALAAHAAAGDLAPLAPLDLPPLPAPWDRELPRTLAWCGPAGGPPRLRIARGQPHERALVPHLCAESVATKILALDRVVPLVEDDDIDVLRALVDAACAALGRTLASPRETASGAGETRPSAARLTPHGLGVLREIDELARPSPP